MDKRLTVALMIIACNVLTACSNRQVYDAVQNNRRLECDKLPDSAQRDECLQQYSESYDEYQRKREEILKQKNAK